MQDRPEGVPRRPLRAHADRQGRQVESQGARIEGRPVRVGGDRALPEARIQRRGGADGDVPRGREHTRGGRHRPAAVGRADAIPDIERQTQEDPQGDRRENRESAMAKAGTVAGEMEERKLKAAANRLREGVGETAACLLPGFPANHGIKLRTDNMVERLNKEIRRRTRVVGGFPDSDSALMLVCAGIRYVASRSWSDRQYMDMSRLDDNPGAAA